MKYHYSDPFFTDPVRRGGGVGGDSLGVLTSGTKHPQDPLQGQCQVGSLTGVVHLSNGNTGLLR